MPRTKTDYTKGLIYKIVCRDNNITDCYVGSRTNITSRRSSHILRCDDENNAKHHYKVYKFIRENGGWNNWNLELIEYFSCEDNDELRAREQHFYELLNSTLNSRPPLATAEYTNNRIEQYKINHPEISKQWRADNQATIKANKKQYYEDNKNTIIDRSHNRYVENKIGILAKNAIYREANRDKRSARRRELYKIKMELEKK